MTAKIFALIALCSTGILCVQFQDCGSPGAVVTSISATNCTASMAKCVYANNVEAKSAYVNVQFTSKVDSSKNIVNISAIIQNKPSGTKEIALDMFMIKDACKWGLKCPVSKGSKQTLKSFLPIPVHLHTSPLDIRVAVVGSNGEKLFCRQFPIYFV